MHPAENGFGCYPSPIQLAVTAPNYYFSSRTSPVHRTYRTVRCAGGSRVYDIYACPRYLPPSPTRCMTRSVPPHSLQRFSIPCWGPEQPNLFYPEISPLLYNSVTTSKPQINTIMCSPLKKDRTEYENAVQYPARQKCGKHRDNCSKHRRWHTRLDHIASTYKELDFSQTLGEHLRRHGRETTRKRWSRRENVLLYLTAPSTCQF